MFSPLSVTFSLNGYPIDEQGSDLERGGKSEAREGRKGK
jgi:hypothetical protein